MSEFCRISRIIVQIMSMVVNFKIINCPKSGENVPGIIKFNDDNDWMHYTACCLGYPSDSSRAARECAGETSCGRHPRRAGQVRPGRILPLCFRSWPGPVRLVPVTLHAPSQHSASVRGGPTSSMLPPSVGVGHCPLAVGLGPSAGLLVCVPYRRPVSPLSCGRLNR